MKRAGEQARTEPQGQMPGQLKLTDYNAIAAETRRLTAIIYAHEAGKTGAVAPLKEELPLTTQATTKSNLHLPLGRTTRLY